MLSLLSKLMKNFASEVTISIKNFYVEIHIIRFTLLTLPPTSARLGVAQEKV